MKTSARTFQDDLCYWRSSLGLTQPQMAAYLGSPLPTYRKWEQGQRKPTQTVLRLVKVLQMVERHTPELHLVLLAGSIED